VVGLQNVSEGATVTRNKELLSLVSMETLYVDFSVPDSYLKYLTLGDTVDVMVEGLDDLLGIECPIIAIDSQVRSSTHSITVRAEVRNDSEQMRPGQFARVTAAFGQEENALLIPVVAVEKDSDQTYVYLIVHDTAVKNDVTLGIRDNDMVQILDGVRKGDQIVVAGQIKLSDGVAVKVVRNEDASGQTVAEKSPAEPPLGDTSAVAKAAS
jgi:membrane fusion protein (multidrug efflux system)